MATGRLAPFGALSWALLALGPQVAAAASRDVPARGRAASAIQVRGLQGSDGLVSEARLGAPGVAETVAEIMSRQAPPSPAASTSDPGSGIVDGERRLPGLPQGIGVSFLAIEGPGPESAALRPDPTGAVGPTQILVATEGRIKVFDRAGVPGVLNTTTDNFFRSWGGDVLGTSNVHIRYDRLSERWFVTAATLKSSDSDCENSVLIAVSWGSTITDSTSFHFYAFGLHPWRVVSPSLAVDRYNLYVGANIQSCPAASETVAALVVSKQPLVDGGFAMPRFFRHLEDDGILAPRGVDNDDPHADRGYLIGTDSHAYGRLGIRPVLPGVVLGGQQSVDVASTSEPVPQAQPAPGPSLDAVGDRLLSAAIHKNRLTGTRTLWTAHAIGVDASGVGGTGSEFDRNGARWYELGELATTPQLVQSGTLSDPAGATPFGYWLPAVAMTGQGHAALVASRASGDPSEGYAGIATAGRLRTDAVDTLQPPTLAQGSSSVYDSPEALDPEPWGAEARIVVDPNDDQTLWAFQEYASAPNTWGVRVLQIKAPPPAAPLVASPSAVVRGPSAVDVTITGDATGGLEFFDPGDDGPDAPPFANHIAAVVGGDVVVNSVRFDGPAQVTLNISTIGARAEAKDVTIVNPDGQAATGTGILVVTCPTVVVGPSTIAGGTAGVAYGQSFTQTGGLGTITWSLAGTLPVGIGLDAASGDLAGTPMQTGNYPITVTATDAGGCGGSVSVTLVVNRAGPFVPAGLRVDSNDNAILEPGETVTLVPAWRNTTGAPEALTGGISAFTGPGDAGSYSITDDAAGYGLVPPGATALCASGDCYGLFLAIPSVRPSRHWDASVLETLSNGDAKSWTLHVGDSFDDVQRASGYYHFIETLYHNSVTGGCTTTSYCPGNPTTRGQMAVFALVGREGAGYTPPTCGATPMFADVPATSPYCRWVEELARRAVVGGCGGGNFCPTAAVTRAQMPIFVLKALDAAIDPPACGVTPMFGDVPAASPYCRWIEELGRRGVVSGCGGGNYCPNNPVNRAQVAVFISATFGLTLYGP